MSKKKTHEEYVKEVSIINPNIEVVENYKGTHTKILHRCLNDNCGYEWYISPHDILQGRCCPKCSGNIRRTHEEFVEEMSRINPHIEILNTYVNTTTKVECRCLIDDCGHIWKSKPSHLLDGHGCPKCAHKNLGKIKTISHECFKEKVKNHNKNIELLSDYINATTKIKYKCLVCGFVGYALPHNLVRDNCPRCSKRERYTTTSFREKILSINPDILVVGEYTGSTTKIECLCLRDGHHWMTEPRLLLIGYGCPQCNETSGEMAVRLWLEKHNINYIFQKTFNDCKNIRLLPFDFYLPEYNCCIEYNGRQHYEPVDFSGNGEKHANEQLNIIQHRDNIKDEYCKNNGISLLRIPYFKNVEEELNNFLFI